MQRRIAYIINPISGAKEKDPLKELIAGKTEAAGIPYDFFPSVESGDYSFLYPLIKENGITDVVIGGGDGTVNGAVNSLKDQDVQFGILPFGSGNGLALSAHIPKKPEKALEVIFKGNSHWTDAFLMNEQFACMLCGLGFDAQVAHDFANDPKRGLSTYIRKTVKNFFNSTSYPLEIRIKSKKLKAEVFFISIANSNQFGNNFTIAPKASLTDGMLDVVIMANQNKFSLLWETMKQVGGFNPLKKPDQLNENASLYYFQTDELEILNPSMAPMHIDGDPVESSARIRISMIKKCFRLISP
jgi:YegS/Rv2252/BmrU family lipid kinase